VVANVGKGCRGEAGVEERAGAGEPGGDVCGTWSTSQPRHVQKRRSKARPEQIETTLGSVARVFEPYWGPGPDADSHWHAEASLRSDDISRSSTHAPLLTLSGRLDT
jgi:hypothetical protein